MPTETVAQESGAPGDLAEPSPAIGVLEARGLYAVHPNGGTWLPTDQLPTSLAACWELAERHRLRQLWVWPDAMEPMGLPPAPNRLRPDRSVASTFTDEGKAAGLNISTPEAGLRPWLSAWRPGGWGLELALVAWEPPTRRGEPPGGPWGPSSCGAILLRQLVAFHDATGGAYWHRSGAITSDVWLREHYRRRRDYLRDTTIPADCADPALEADLHWHRGPQRQLEHRAGWCHAYDVNGQYLGAASSLALGVGEPLHHDSATWTALELQEAFRRPGYWRVIGPPDVDPAGGAPFHRWVTAPSLVYLHEVAGAELSILEGWSYPEHHRFLEPWYRTWRDARTSLMAGTYGPALEAVKTVYRQGVGRLGSARRARGNADPLAQPYWRQAVIAEARTRLLRRVAKLRQAPVAIDVDCLYFLTSTRDPGAFAARIGLPIGEGLGTFHHRGTRAGGRARAALREPDSLRALAELREVVA